MLDGQYSDKAFEFSFKKDRSLTEYDKSLIVSNVYYIVRNWRLLKEIDDKIGFKAGETRCLVGIALILQGADISSYAKFTGIHKLEVQTQAKTLSQNRAIADSVPDWLDQTAMAELGEKWPPILKSLNAEPYQVIRVNTLKTSCKALREILFKKGVETMENAKSPEALIVKHKINIFQLTEFKDGLFEVQDVSSQQVSHFANPKPGMRVVDACAGSGGKTLHLAAIMQNRGKIIALDLYPSKLETLRKRARRAGVSIIEPKVIESTKVIKRLYDTADLVILDVPCSGLGVLKRNPEIKWRLQSIDLQNLHKTQEDLLNRYSRMVKPGGRMVYSTCSILPSENSLQIQAFLQQCEGKFELSGGKIISPEEGFDGFYMAELKRIK